MTESTSATLSFEAGRFVRDDVLFQLKTLALRLGVQIEVDENRGWVESAYTVRISGTPWAVKGFVDTHNAWRQQLRRDGFA